MKTNFTQYNVAQYRFTHYIVSCILAGLCGATLQHEVSVEGPSALILPGALLGAGGVALVLLRHYLRARQRQLVEASLAETSDVLYEREPHEQVLLSIGEGEPFPCDVAMVELVKALNAAGVRTEGCCQGGHVRAADGGQAPAYVDLASASEWANLLRRIGTHHERLSTAERHTLLRMGGLFPPGRESWNVRLRAFSEPLGVFLCLPPDQVDELTDLIKRYALATQPTS